MITEQQAPVEISSDVQNAESGVEIAPIAEMIPTGPAPVAPAQDAVAPDVTNNVPVVTVQADTAEVEVHPESEQDSASDSDWVGKVRDIIREDKDDPYKEEEDSEGLQEDYMRSRFSVDVDAPEGE